MNSKKVLNSILVISLARCVLADQYDPSLKYIVDYMKNNLLTYQVTVTVTSAEGLCSFSSNIVKVMIDEFSSIVIDKDVCEGIPAVKPLENLWRRAIYQSKLKIVVLEISHMQNVLQELKYALFFLMKYSNNVRGKCIIFLINEGGQSLEPFLRFAWSWDFLDITVVEWVNTTETRTLAATEILASQVLVHIFDPFQDKYTKDRLSNTTDILPQKTKNLHGYNFYADLRGAPGSDVHRRHRESGVKPMKYLKDTLNFTLTYEGVNNSEGSMTSAIDFYRQNVSHEHPIDIFLNLQYFDPRFNVSHPRDYMLEMSYYLLSLVDNAFFYEYHFSILQEKTPEFKMSFNFLTTCVALSAMGLIFLLSSRVMEFDKKIWSPVKIARALMGGTLEDRREIKLAEKILLITLYFVSIVMMTLTSDELLKMAMSTRDVLQCTTLDELADSRMTLHMEKKTSEVLSMFGENDPKLQKIANKSTVILSESGLIMHYKMLEISKWYTDINAYGAVREMYNHYGPDMDQEEEVSLTQRLLIILVPGYVLASIALIWEIFFQSRRPVEFEKLNSKRKRFVRCLVEEAKSKIKQESSREFDLIQSLNELSQSNVMTLVECRPENLSRLPVNSDHRKKNKGCNTKTAEDRLELFRLLELDNALLIAYLDRKKCSRIQMRTHYE
ncbi:hypothetical protein QAD02_010918 [Eretmocerus hayati]|uniref:Uncharacterized protein n=1 Tax=Eretmocerus hayati TaxID=131215 RepID=A0ACC2NY56_9HYME|nr:hypothetical protein QAD02_010918 [Eretmocerus hayati]